jgi:hypothetical protein
LFRLDGTPLGDGPATSFDARLDPWGALVVEVRQ